MRRLVVALGGVAFSLLPATGHALDTGEARHLLLRTAFGTPPAALRELRDLDRSAAVKTLLDRTTTVATVPPPGWVDIAPDWPAFYRSTYEPMRQAFNQDRDREAAELKAWWYAEMIATPSPLTERMALFWHGHFTSSMEKVRAPDLLYGQNVLFRRHATGNFRTLLRGVARDPAMVRYLDTSANSKGGPNENFARELFELFTLGPGNYTERDIKEAARAFTGGRVDASTRQFAYAQREHDENDKTVFGHTGNFSGDDVVDLILDRPAAAVFVVTRLWREFVSDTPDPAEIARLADRFREGRYEIKPLLAALFATPAFWAEENRGTMVKSPVELIVGTIRTFDLQIADTRSLVEFGRRLRQDIFNPPNVKGWPGGSNWISTVTLLARHDLLERLLRGQNLLRPAENPAMMMMAAPATAAESAAPPRRGGLAAWMEANPAGADEGDTLATLLIARSPVRPLAEAGLPQERLEQLLLDPAYQLK